jgi:hypothetical protein
MRNDVIINLTFLATGVAPREAAATSGPQSGVPVKGGN